MTDGGQRRIRVWSLWLTVPAIALNAWIVTPAPAQFLALLAIPLTEGWSQWTSLLGALGLVRVAWEMRRFPSTRVRASLVCGVLGVCAGLVPVFSALRVARQQGVEVSAWRAATAVIDRGDALGVETVSFHRFPDGRELLMDVSGAHPGEQRVPLVVVHGGGWNARDKSDLPRFNAWMVEQGFTVFDVQYRLSPQPNWRESVGDVKCAAGVVASQAERFGIDASRMVLLGRSAGGHLAMMAGYSVGHPQLPPSCEVPEVRPARVVEIYGPTDLAWSYYNPTNRLVYDGPANLRRFLGGTPEDVRDLYVLLSPITHVNAQTPPTLLIHAGTDQFVNPFHMRFMQWQLIPAGVKHKAVYLPYGQHGFDYAFGGWGWQITSQVLVRWLRTL